MNKSGIISIFCAVLFLLLSIPDKAQGGVYVRPVFGYAYPIGGGDGSWTAGAALGYSFPGGLSLETGYTRYMPTGNSLDSNLWDINAVYGLTLPLITPFVTAGGGLFWNSPPGLGTQKQGVINMGAGAYLNFLPIIDIGMGFTYQILTKGKDLIYPNLYLGLSF